MASGCVFGGRSLQARSPAVGTENRFICHYYAAPLPSDSLFSWSIDALPMLERLGVCGKISPSGVAGVYLLGRGYRLMIGALHTQFGQSQGLIQQSAMMWSLWV